MATVVCRNCEERVLENFAFVTSRFGGGGAYNRAGRYYPTRICADCAAWLVATTTPGHWRSNYWDVSGLELGLKDLGRVVPERGSEYNDGRYGAPPEHFSKEARG